MSLLFRKSALDRVSSPEQLDQLLPVTSSRGWVAVVSVALAVSCAVAWAFIGRLPREVAGDGVLVHRSRYVDTALLQVPSPTAGLLVDLLVEPGQDIEENQLVAHLRPSNRLKLETDTDRVRKEIEDLKRRMDVLRTYHKQELVLSTRKSSFQEERLKGQLDSEKSHLRGLEEHLKNISDLHDEGIVPTSTVLTTQAERDGQVREVSRVELELKEIPLKLERLRHDQETATFDMQYELNRAKDRLRSLEDELSHHTEVRSPYAGHVVRWDIAKGSEVKTGQSLLILDAVTDQDETSSLEYLLFVPLFEGKQIQKGMKVQVSPSTVPREEFGFVLGEVTVVAKYAASRQSMVSVLEDPQLVDSILGAVKVPLQVWVRLETDPDSTSGLKWSGGSGPEQRISVGTPASGLVVVEERRPIELVMPALKKSLGLE